MIYGGILAREALKMHTFNTVYRAALSGDKEEQYRLAQMYRLGRMVAADRKKAMMWFNIASGKGHDYRCTFLST